MENDKAINKIYTVTWEVCYRLEMRDYCSYMKKNYFSTRQKAEEFLLKLNKSYEIIGLDNNRPRCKIEELEIE